MTTAHRFKVAGCKFACFVAILLLAGCHHQPNQITRAVYYWKTDLSIDHIGYQQLDSLGIRKVYVRFFDVDLDAANKSPVPVSPVVFDKGIPGDVACVPVIFIRNRVFTSLEIDSVPVLAKRMFRLMASICKANGKTIREMQLDCDWTTTTKDKYFLLAKTIGESCKTNGVKLSATIRLHQIKYLEKTGVPPVDRGMLMFYNMGKLEDTTTSNSIFDAATAMGYTSRIKTYPLPLDVVLPMFSWAVHMRDGKVIGLPDIDAKMLVDTANFILDNATHFTLKQDFKYKTVSFNKGDKLRIEKCGIAECNEAAKLVRQYLKDEARTVSIFDFQPDNFFQNGRDSIRQVYERFN